jgi:hypothetical protein
MIGKKLPARTTALREAIILAGVDQCVIAREAGVVESDLSAAANGRRVLSERRGRLIQDALAARGVIVTLDEARGI